MSTEGKRSFDPLAMASLRWKRLIRFIPKGEKIAYYGEPIFSKDQDRTYISESTKGIKARILHSKDFKYGIFEDTGVIKEIGTVSYSYIFAFARSKLSDAKCLRSCLLCTHHRSY